MTVHKAFINELEDALSHGTDERRAKALRRVTDLFVLGSSYFSNDQIAVFDTVFNHLIADMERSARALLAERLAAIPNGPPDVIRRLAFDDVIDVAGPVLSQSEMLDNSTLVENARTKSSATSAGDFPAKGAGGYGDRCAGRTGRPPGGAQYGAQRGRQILGNGLCPAGEAVRG